MKDRAISVRRTGAQHPLFLVHEGTGAVQYAQMLAPDIDDNIPIYALPSVSAAEPQLRTVEGMAMRHVRMIRTVQPAGPYRVAGWSFGGTLGYEIAAQLIGQDQVIEFLGLIDTIFLTGDNVGHGIVLDEKRWLLRFLQTEDIDERTPSSFEELASAARTVDCETLVKKCEEMMLLPPYLKEVLGYRWDVYRALSEYFPQPIPIPIHLFSAQGEPNTDLRRGWQNLCPEASIRASTSSFTSASSFRISKSLARPRAVDCLFRKLHSQS